MEFMLPRFYFTHKKVHSAQNEVQQTRKKLHPLAVGIRKLLTHTIISGLQAWVKDTVYESNSAQKVREQCNCVIQVFYYANENIFEGFIY